MIQLFFSILFFLNSAFAGLPPTTVKGQSETNKVTTFNVQAPYSQATTTAGATRLIETGNPNILVNGSFENSSFLTGWTQGTGVFTEETTNRVDGLKSAKIDVTATTGDILSQSVTPTQQMTGLNVTVSFYAKTTVANFQLCQLQATAEVGGCVDISSSGNWDRYQVTFPGPASGSIGLKLKTSASVTGTIYIDGASVQFLQPPQVSVSSISNEIDAGTITVGAVTTAPTKGTTTLDKVTYYKVGKYAILTYRFQQSAGGAAGSGTYLYSLPPGLLIDTTYVTPTGSAALSTGTSSANIGTGRIYSTTGPTAAFSVFVSAYSTSQFYVYNQLMGTTGNNFHGSTSTPFSEIIGFTFNIAVPIQGWTASTGAAPASQADYGWTSWTPTFTGLGTPTSVECEHRKMSENLEARCKFTTGTTTAVEARVAFPNSLTSVSSTSLPSIKKCGDMSSSSTFAGSEHVLCEPSVGYFTFALQGASSAGLTKVTGTTLGNTTTFSFTASVPILSWAANQRSPTLTGSVTSNAVSALRVENAQVAVAGTVSNETSDWINGNATGTTTKTLTLNSNIFSATPACFVTSLSGSYSCNINSASTSTIAVDCTNYTAGQNGSFNITCTGPR